MRTRTALLVAAGALLALSPAWPARAEELQRGQVVERVAAAADASQTYALYLPSRYTGERAWPLLLCFDPAGRGRVPVERFREAAEKYGWVVVGSNNSRNGPVRPSLEAAQAMWIDVRARLRVDERRVYAAGFSGGARLAVRVNHLCQNCLAGVVAAGAGFPSDITPTASARFALFAAAGTDDFNFPELKRLDERLARLSFPRRLAVFDGGHAWPPPEVCARAVEWMELEAMRSGRRARDEALVAELWAREERRASADDEAGRVYAAYLGYASLAEDFKGLRDVAGAAEKASRLGASKEVRAAREEESAQLREQERLFRDIAAHAERARDANEGTVAASVFRRAAADLRKAARAEADTSERRVARRALGELFAHFYERAANARERGGGAAAVVADLEAASELAPDSPQVFVELARAHALDRNKGKALASLRRAVENGFADAEALARDESLATLRGEAAYKEILARLQPRPRPEP